MCLGFAGQRGDGPRKYSEDHQREILARIEAGLVTTKEAAAEVGVSPSAIYSLRQAFKKKDVTAAQIETFTPSPVPVGSMRQARITRPDGTILEIEMTAEEMMRMAMG